MNCEEALDGCMVHREDAIYELRNHGVVCWIEGDTIWAEVEDFECETVAEIIDGEVNTSDVMAFLGY